MNKADIDVAARMAEFLPDALETAITSYRKYAQVKEDTKKYKEAQAACRVALGHIALLMKLNVRVREEGAPMDEERLNALLASADAELSAFQGFDKKQ